MNEEERNPHLPEPPEDGQHVFSDGPTDLGGNRRCTLCGAYRGSDEAAATCKGEWAESGKMRSHAARLWMEDKLREGGPVRWVRMLIIRQQASVALGRSVSFSGVTRYFFQLDCGHEREVDYDQHRMASFGGPVEAACLDPACVIRAREAHLKLNPHSAGTEVA